jgi:hypothetical protein
MDGWVGEIVKWVGVRFCREGKEKEGFLVFLSLFVCRDSLKEKFVFLEFGEREREKEKEREWFFTQFKSLFLAMW